ncbi:MAG TPA: AAA domain-containing protein [Acidobacteriaceae bacterium]|nr:AAA domain-containing protein [Acidobacteriaceae bacterium]HUB00551.1 AAA domain-containing protein [Terracidiphilus sp.]
MSEPRELLVRLLDYIKEQAKVIDPRGFVLGSAGAFLRRRKDVAGLQGVEFDLRVESDHIWMRVPRLASEPPPSAPESYKAVISLSPNPDGPLPSLDERVLNWELNQAVQKRFADKSTDDPDVQEEIQRFRVNWWEKSRRALESYTLTWKSWANAERERRKTITLYGDLFALMHSIEAEQTNKPQELVWGIGISTWRLAHEKGKFSFEYPLLTQAIEISLDDKSMAIELRPRATDTQVEFDAITACHVEGAIEVEKAAIDHLNKHKDRPVTPFDTGSYSDALKLIAANLDCEGIYQEVLLKGDPVPAAGEHLVVTDAWVLFSRPRTVNFLFEDLKRLGENLNDGCTIPDGPMALVSEPSDEPLTFQAVSFRGISSRGETGGSHKPQDLFFPLPYNEEQVTIVKNLTHAAGVAVQGPPGTGKTHTIANIICHYLAQGKRVLVTSRGDAALNVLQEKIPDDVRSLTVSLLASDREGVRQFQASIETIQHRVSQLNPELTMREIERCQIAIDRAHAELLSIDRRINEIALHQLSEIEVDGVPMRAQKLAELVLSGNELHGWFDDAVSLTPNNAPPFDDSEAGRIRHARRNLGADLVYVDKRVPSAEIFPLVAEISRLHDLLVEKNRIEGELHRDEQAALKAFTPKTLATARTFLQSIDETLELLTDIEEAGKEWPFALRVKCQQSSFVSERRALEELLNGLDELVSARAEFLMHPVSIAAEVFDNPKSIEAIRNAADTGKPFGLLSFGAADAKRHIQGVRIDGKPPANAEEWAHVHRYVILHSKVHAFCIRWNGVTELLSIPPLNGGLAGLRQIEVTATLAQKAHRLATHYDALLSAQALEVFTELPDELSGGTRSELEVLRQRIIQVLTLDELSHAPIRLAQLTEKLAGCSGPVVDAMRSFVESSLGNGDLSNASVASLYTELLAELRRIAGLASEMGCIREGACRIAEAGAPKLAERVRSVPVASSGDDGIFPVTWRDAWNWARMREHLDRIEGRAELRSLAERRRELEVGLSRFYREMVAKSAWLATKKNATPRILQALAGYAIAVRRIGQGTGPNATRYRRDARQAMFDAAGAVPCWIMNHTRISEAMPPEIGMFDLVIVDEASQSDLWALPAILRGEKILVVGDDKQVSPDGGFIDSGRIQELRQRFLSEQPYAAEMTPEKSLYDLAARVFAATQIMLREHFRCVPPIIAYSNRTFYKGQIQPLRIPRASERIEPPLVDIYVEGGVRDAHDCNHREAEVIADEINAILANEKLRGRTIGVVSLLGGEQAKLIDSVVTRKCDAGELHRRKFLCGDARTFQGSERHIMFLSLVVDPLNCKALSGNMFDQRFNVAASRAQDRMYLVRSVQLSDLSDKDLRTGLLTHFDNPLVVDKVEAEVLIDRCESGFEKQVYSELVSRGYRVTPQVKTGAYRIDMVVEGQGDLRLAIECDGDEFHGADRWQHDLSRQRVLERAGWVFWRCFASTWVLRKDEVMEELVQFLYCMGIEPLGAIETASRIVEKRVVKPESDKPVAQSEQSFDASSSQASGGTPDPAYLELEIPQSSGESTQAHGIGGAILAGADVNIPEPRSSESPKRQAFQKGDSVTYRTNKGKRRTAVVAWTDGKQVKLIDNGATVSKSVDDILTVSGLESNLLN